MNTLFPPKIHQKNTNTNKKNTSQAPQAPLIPPYRTSLPPRCGASLPRGAGYRLGWPRAAQRVVSLRGGTGSGAHRRWRLRWFGVRFGVAFWVCQGKTKKSKNLEVFYCFTRGFICFSHVFFLCLLFGRFFKTLFDFAKGLSGMNLFIIWRLLEQSQDSKKTMEKQSGSHFTESGLFFLCLEASRSCKQEMRLKATRLANIVMAVTASFVEPRPSERIQNLCMCLFVMCFSVKES